MKNRCTLKSQYQAAYSLVWCLVAGGLVGGCKNSLKYSKSWGMHTDGEEASVSGDRAPGVVVQHEIPEDGGTPCPDQIPDVLLSEEVSMAATPSPPLSLEDDEAVRRRIVEAETKEDLAAVIRECLQHPDRQYTLGGDVGKGNVLHLVLDREEEDVAAVNAILSLADDRTATELLNGKTTNYGMTPLMLAIYDRGKDLARVLAGDLRGDLTLRDSHKRTALCYAFLGRQIEIIEQIVKRDTSTLWAGYPEDGELNMLHLMGEYAQDDEIFLDQLFKLKEIEGLIDVQESRGGNTPLHAAIIYQNQWLFNHLLDHGADINIRNEEGDSPKDKRGYSLLWASYVTSGRGL